MSFLERLDKVVGYALVKVFTAEMSVSGCCKHLKYAIVDRKDRNVECATAEVEDHDVLFLLLVQPVCNRGC